MSTKKNQDETPEPKYLIYIAEDSGGAFPVPPDREITLLPIRDYPDKVYAVGDNLAAGEAPADLAEQLVAEGKAAWSSKNGKPNKAATVETIAEAVKDEAKEATAKPRPSSAPPVADTPPASETH